MGRFEITALAENETEIKKERCEWVRNFVP